MGRVDEIRVQWETERGVVHHRYSEMGVLSVSQLQCGEVEMSVPSVSQLQCGEVEMWCAASKLRCG